MAASSTASLATLASTSKVASEFGETAVHFPQAVADLGVDHGRAVACVK